MGVKTFLPHGERERVKPGKHVEVREKSSHKIHQNPKIQLNNIVIYQHPPTGHQLKPVRALPNPPFPRPVFIAVISFDPRLRTGHRVPVHEFQLEFALLHWRIHIDDPEFIEGGRLLSVLVDILEPNRTRKSSPGPFGPRKGNRVS